MELATGFFAERASSVGSGEEGVSPGAGQQGDSRARRQADLEPAAVARFGEQRLHVGQEGVADVQLLAGALQQADVRR